jgi:hypothetical protein
MKEMFDLKVKKADKAEINEKKIQVRFLPCRSTFLTKIRLFFDGITRSR